jgi:hypothetical protein
MIRLAFSTSLALCLVSVPARADPPVVEPVVSARLEYVVGAGAESCPGERDLRDAVGLRLGRDPFTPEAPERLIVKLTGSGTTLYADVALYGAAGQGYGGRQLVESSGDCTRLLASVALTISLALAPGRSSRAEPLPTTRELRAPAPEALPRRPAPRPTSPTSTPPELPSSPWRFEVSAGGGIAAGSAPDAAGGLAMGLAFGKDRWSFGLEARGYFPDSRDASTGGSIAVSLISGAALPCYELAGPFFGCALVALGALRGEGTGVDVPQEDSTLFLGLGMRAGFNVPLFGRFALRVHGDAMWTPLTREMHLADQVVWTTPPGAVGAGGEFVTFF